MSKTTYLFEPERMDLHMFGTKDSATLAHTTKRLRPYKANELAHHLVAR
jgi:hypothetical protein